MSRTFQSLVLLFGLALPGAMPALAQPAFPAAPREVLVKFRTVDPARTLQVERDQDIEDTREVGAGVLRLRSRSRDALTLVRQLAARPDVEYAEPNYIVHAIAVPNDYYYPQLWGMPKIGAPAAWSVSTGSAATVVAVVDTGVDYTHPDLAGNIWSAPAAFTVIFGSRQITCGAGSHGFNAITLTCDPMDDNNHGTHVSGTIGGVGNNGIGVAGVNWTASIMGTKFLDSSGSGYTSDAVNAIEFAIQAKLAFGAAANVRVLSNSWGGGGFSQTLLDEINRASSNGMLFVAAAGNSGLNIDASPSYPASYTAANVVAVAATDSNDALASWSNYGATSVDLAAPGVGILSTVRGGYANYSGTSMATPHVSGAAALVLSRCTLDTAGLKANLLSNVDAVAALAGKTVTGGRLNVAKAINACAGTGTPDFSVTASPASQPVNQGGSTSYTITITAVNGFAGAVGFGVTGLPAGASASFSPASISGSGSATMTVTTSGSTPGGTYTLTVTGTSDSLAHSTTAALKVNVPDFSLSASPASQTVAPGGSASYTISVTPLNGFTGTVSFGNGALPAEVTAAWSANVLKLTTTTSTAGGTYPVTVTGTSGSLQHTITVTLVVSNAGFTLAVSPASLTVSRGSRARYTVTVGATGGFTGKVTFSVAGVPGGATASFSPSSVAGSGSSTLTVRTYGSTATGTFTLTLTGTSGTQVVSKQVTLTVH